MEKTLCKPYKNCTIADISQKFGENPNPIQPNGHTGVDFVSKKGTWLVAPEKCQITNLVDNLDLDENSDEEVRRGYGVVMKSLSKPDTYYLYWHCFGIFPVKINDVVEQGQPVAQMSNSGYVLFGGMYVPIGGRNKYETGTHLHYEYFTEINGVREFHDILPEINFSIPVNDNGILEAISKVIQNILSIFKK